MYARLSTVHLLYKIEKVPGNVRELENVIERALILNTTSPLSFEHMNLPIIDVGNSIKEQVSDTDNLDEMTSKYIRRVLTKTNGKIHGKGAVADLLGINPSTLRNRMNKLGIEYRKKS
jgi:DNA-binding NtrC family response regulator